jgi:hypothetical protein
MPRKPQPAPIGLLDQIAHTHLGLASLRPRGHDALDFPEVGVWSLADALAAAYAAGYEAGRGQALVARTDAAQGRYGPARMPRPHGEH